MIEVSDVGPTEVASANTTTSATAGSHRCIGGNPTLGAMPQTLPASLRALLDAAAALIRKSSSGRVALARAADVVVPEALPGVLRDRLPAALRDAYDATTEPLDAKKVQKAVKKLVDDLDAAPLAVRPVAQVHAATVDGAPVVVKVRRPGLAATIRGDLALIDAIAGPLGGAFPALDVGAMLREAREAAQDELDLEHEGASQRQAGRALRGIVTVPAVHSELTTEDVLVSDRIDGPTLADAQPDDPATLVRALVRAHVTAWRQAGLILTDVRPGHVVLLRDGGVGLLGAGVSRPGDRERADAFLDAFVTLTTDDADAFATTVVDRLRTPAGRRHRARGARAAARRPRPARRRAGDARRRRSGRGGRARSRPDRRRARARRARDPAAGRPGGRADARPVGGRARAPRGDRGLGCPRPGVRMMTAHAGVTRLGRPRR